MSEQQYIVTQHQCEHGQLARVCNVCELQARVKELEAQRDELLKAAQSVVDRWHTPLWKDVPATAVFIGKLQSAIAKIEASRSGVDAERKS